MNNCALSKDGKYLYFPALSEFTSGKILAGVTTNRHEDFCAIEANGKIKEIFKPRAQALSESLGQGCLAYLVPEHGKRIEAVEMFYNFPLRGYLGDGLIFFSSTPGIKPMLSIQTADCCNAFFTDKDASFYMLIHSGKNGTKANILGHAVMRLKQTGINLEDVAVAVWQGICGECYELPAEELDKFWFYGRFRETLDLPKIANQQLVSAGIRQKQIFTAPICPKHFQFGGDYLFASRRRNYGQSAGDFRNAAFITAT